MRFQAIRKILNQLLIMLRTTQLLPDLTLHNLNILLLLIMILYQLRRILLFLMLKRFNRRLKRYINFKHLILIKRR